MRHFESRRLGIMLVAGLLAAGCTAGPLSPREGGALSGAAIGAASGAMIGGASGDAGEGALIGGAVGAIAGAIIGDSVQARDQRLARDRALAEELRARDLDARDSDRGVVVNLPDVLFEFGRSELADKARAKVRTIAEVVNGPGTAWRRVSVEGYTDSVGSQESNLRLSERRARAVADTLAGLGVAASRLSVRGFGEAYPVAANVYGDGSDNPQGRAMNRRVQVIILNEVDDQAPAQQAPVVQPGYPGYPPGPYYPPPYGGYPGYPPPGYPPYPPGPPPYGY